MFKFWIIPGSFGLLCINRVSGHLMCIIQIWTTSTCSNAPKFAEKSHVWIYRSHARNENKIQTYGCRGSAEKIEKLGFLILVIPKHAWNSWNLAWSHDMAPTCCGNFSLQFAKAHTLTINKVILEQVLSRYKSETQVLFKPWAFYLPITCRHTSPFLLARRCRAG